MVFSDNHTVLLPSVKIESEREKRERHATERLDDPTTFLTTTTAWIQRGRKRSRDPNSSHSFLYD